MKRISTIREFVDAELGRFFDVIYDAIEYDVPALYFVPSCIGDVIPNHFTVNGYNIDNLDVKRFSIGFRDHFKIIYTKKDWHFSESLEAMYEAELHAIKYIIEISLHQRVKYGKAN